MNYFDIIKIDPDSRVHKYRQVVNSITSAIKSGKLKLNQKIPSINWVSEEFYLSRDTVEKAYRILKNNKIIVPVRGKGFYISRVDLSVHMKILFLINKLSPYKMRIYNSFIENIEGDAVVDVLIYHCDELLFCDMLEKNIGTYDYYVIMPHFKNEKLQHISFTNNVVKSLKNIPKEKLVLLDNQVSGVPGIIEIYQDFENDIYLALKSLLPKILKYKRAILVYPQTSIYPYPRRILRGFIKFCGEHDISFELIDEIYDDVILKSGDLFVVIGEDDLVNLVKQVRAEKIVLGKDLGIISYNETPLKELLDIAVISTDFISMGEKAAEMILNHEKGSLKNSFNTINRGSF